MLQIPKGRVAFRGVKCTYHDDDGAVRRCECLLLRTGKPAKRERPPMSAYKLLVDISSVTSLPAMCRLLSAL